MNKSKKLKKSIDSMIDELFVEDKTLAKSMDHLAIRNTTADEAIAAAPVAEKDEARGAGRPKQIREIPQRDDDGKMAGDYDKDITDEHAAEDVAEADQVKSGKRKKEEEKEPKDEEIPSVPDVKMEDVKKSISMSAKKHKKLMKMKKAYKMLKKAMKKEKVKAKQLKKSSASNMDLIQSAVNEATKKMAAENSELKKSLEVVRAMANKPQAPKAITSMSALEKGGMPSRSGSVSKAELEDVAEKLVKSGELSLDHAIELSQTGRIYDADARAILESAVRSGRK